MKSIKILLFVGLFFTDCTFRDQVSIDEFEMLMSESRQRSGYQTESGADANANIGFELVGSHFSEMIGSVVINSSIEAILSGYRPYYEPQQHRVDKPVYDPFKQTRSQKSVVTYSRKDVVKLDRKEFPVPQNCVQSVSFWIRIFTEVTESEGLLHDRRYPEIIYRKVTINNADKKQLRDLLAEQRQEIRDMLTRLQTLPREQYNEAEMRIADLFSRYGTQDALFDAESNIRFQQGMMERFKRGVERSYRYLDTMKAIFNSFDLPQCLVYLPHIESSFDIEAYSHRGAVGMWQFMRATGKQYLNINNIVDERRDPIRSTYAAAKLLKANYSLLQSWPLAVTAYNHGAYGMKRAVRRTGSDDLGHIIEHYESRSFGFASKNFYSSYIAAALVAQNYRHYYPDISPVQPFDVHVVKLHQGITPHQVCDVLGITIEQFRTLNPAFAHHFYENNSKIPCDYRINIPKHTDFVTIATIIDTDDGSS